MEDVRLDARQIRVLAHPLRARLLGALRVNGPATATALAKELDTNTGATSYHLRQLADAGLVAEEDRGSGGRQRWWRALHESSSWSRHQFDDDPDAAAAADWMEAYQIERMAARAEAWRTAALREPEEWRTAAGVADIFVTLTPERTRRLTDELLAVVERYRTTPDEDGRRVAVYLAALPEVP